MPNSPNSTAATTTIRQWSIIPAIRFAQRTFPRIPTFSKINASPKYQISTKKKGFKTKAVPHWNAKKLRTQRVPPQAGQSKPNFVTGQSGITAIIQAVSHLAASAIATSPRSKRTTYFFFISHHIKKQLPRQLLFMYLRSKNPRKNSIRQQLLQPGSGRTRKLPKQLRNIPDQQQPDHSLRLHPEPSSC